MAAGPALLAAAEEHARAIDALPDPMLAARADDVRSLGAAGGAHRRRRRRRRRARTGRRSSSSQRTSGRRTWPSMASGRPASRCPVAPSRHTPRSWRAHSASHDGPGGRRAARGRPTARRSSWTARRARSCSTRPPSAWSRRSRPHARARMRARGRGRTARCPPSRADGRRVRVLVNAARPPRSRPAWRPAPRERA